MRKKIYFLHGFMGDPSDWDGVIKHLPEFDCTALTYPFKLPEDGILVGYSMGGRIAFSSSLPKIVISGHPGLKNQDEKEAQAERENYWIQKLKSIPFDEFVKEWYDQPLFKTLKSIPTFPKIFERRLQQNPTILLEQLEEHPLSLQPVQLDHVTFLYGEYDEKYKNIYKSLTAPAFEIPKAGHACHLENPEATAYQIKSLINRIN